MSLQDGAAARELSVSLSVRPSSAPGPRAASSGVAMSGAARPSVWIGAPSVGGLTLPEAMPTAGHMYAPRGVWLDGDRLIVADTGNHRVLIWNEACDLVDHAEADVILGQPDFHTEGAQAGGRGSDKGMRLPTGILVHQGRLVVADAWNHRVLIWDSVPTRSDQAPDMILGQADPFSIDENRGGNCGPLGFYWPFGIGMIDGWFFVADTGNRRVLAWSTIPTPDQKPDLVLGQDHANIRDENRGQIGPKSFRWPHDVAGVDGRLVIADAGNHRLLGWSDTPHTDVDADSVLGQTDFVTGSEFPYAPQSATAMRFPYAVEIDGCARPGSGSHPMAVADTANNRILIWDDAPSGSGAPADWVLGQPDFASNGENRWDAVGRDTLCWPYGLSFNDGRLAIADSGNNRVMIWDTALGDSAASDTT